LPPKSQGGILWGLGRAEQPGVGDWAGKCAPAVDWTAPSITARTPRRPRRLYGWSGA